MRLIATDCRGSTFRCVIAPATLKIFFALAGLLLGVGLLAFLLLYFGQNRLIYPIPDVNLPADALSGSVTKIDLESSYGLLMPAVLKNGEHGPLIIFTHGNREAAFQWLDEFEALQDNGISILLVEYPGYAGAPGKPSLQSVKQAVVSAYDVARELPYVDASRIVAYGRSVGGGAAALLAENRPVSALCLESTFSSLEKLVSENGAPTHFLKDRYDNKSIVENLSIPVFIYHGTEDTIIPLSHAHALSSAAADATLLTEKCGHSDCPRPWQALQDFLDSKAPAVSASAPAQQP